MKKYVLFILVATFAQTNSMLLKLLPKGANQSRVQSQKNKNVTVRTKKKYCPKNTNVNAASSTVDSYSTNNTKLKNTQYYNPEISKYYGFIPENSNEPIIKYVVKKRNDLKKEIEIIKNHPELTLELTIQVEILNNFIQVLKKTDDLFEPCKELHKKYSPDNFSPLFSDTFNQQKIRTITNKTGPEFTEILLKFDDNNYPTQEVLGILEKIKMNEIDRLNKEYEKMKNENPIAAFIQKIIFKLYHDKENRSYENFLVTIAKDSENNPLQKYLNLEKILKSYKNYTDGLPKTDVNFNKKN